ncbi:MAG: CHAP domain-containing protein [Nitrospira sp. LK70]|nr:CHAP domain-containing protein [Nitrospira sp. LK70]
MYPGYYVKVGVKDQTVVRAVQRRLNDLGCGPIPVSGTFDSQTKSAVQLFQARSVDSQGLSLKIDGVIGPLTWVALFGSQSLPSIGTVPVSPLLDRTLGIAAAEIGVMEVPPGSNRGPRVDEYLQSVGLDASEDSYPWCAAFVYWSFQKAAAQVGSENPCIRTAGVLDHWSKAGQAGATRLSPKAVIDDFSLLKPGLIFVISTGEGKGHMGIVEDFRDDRLVTIEGNTNLPGDREGIGVFRRTSRKLSDINKGFISYDA